MALHDAAANVEGGIAVTQAMGQYFNAINASCVPNMATSKHQITFFQALKHHIQSLTSGKEDSEDEGVEADERGDTGGKPEDQGFHMQLQSHSTPAMALTPQQGGQTSMARKASASAVYKCLISCLTYKC